MIRGMINKKLIGIDLESLKENDMLYQLFIYKLIEYIEDNCDYFKLDKSKAYIHLGEILYKEEKQNEDSKTNRI